MCYEKVVNFSTGSWKIISTGHNSFNRLSPKKQFSIQIFLSLFIALILADHPVILFYRVFSGTNCFNYLSLYFITEEPAPAEEQAAGN